jgi:pilus assembly protein FimV
LIREYTALLDPPTVAPEPAAPPVAVAPEVRPAPAPPRVEAVPVAPAVPVSRPILTAPAAERPQQYGPIERGETLGAIARTVMPEGVTLEQMLVALYRHNTDAFIRDNLNLVRAGRILRVPDREEVAAIARGEAVKEYRTHVADWNAYRQRLADAAGMSPAAADSAARGRITARVEEAPGAEAKDVLRLSKGEAVADDGRPLDAAARMRMLEEEAIAREKALTEANERIAQLEKTLRDMQKLVEMRSPGMAAAQQQAELAAKTAPVAPAVRPDTPAAAKPEPAPVAEQPKPAPKPKAAVVAPPPPPEPGLMDRILAAVSDPTYLAAGGGVLLLGGLAFMMVRRRRATQFGEDDGGVRFAPALDTSAAPDGPAEGAMAQAEASAASDDVDPLAEAEVYIAYGRDGQAEEILKEALARNPRREDVQLKLLEIYAGRRDKSAFARLAGGLHNQIGGASESWLKVAAMGYALDPGNELYAAGKGAQIEEPLAGNGSGAEPNVDVDLGLGGEVGGTTTDITLEAEAVQAATQTVVDAGAIADGGRADEARHAPLMPDFTLDVPPAGDEPTQTNIAVDAPAKSSHDEHTIDFQMELPKVDVPADDSPTTVSIQPPGGGLDFKLDLPDVDLNLEDQPKTVSMAPEGAKDDHWYDVQTKFDLAKAYQEMGDKAGAKEILQEVINEGDADQKSQAQALLKTLD